MKDPNLSEQLVSFHSGETCLIFFFRVFRILVSFECLTRCFQCNPGSKCAACKNLGHVYIDYAPCAFVVFYFVLLYFVESASAGKRNANNAKHDDDITFIIYLSSFFLRLLLAILFSVRIHLFICFLLLRAWRYIINTRPHTCFHAYYNLNILYACLVPW